MVLAMESFAMPTPSARKELMVINTSAHAETVGEGMEPTALILTSANRPQPSVT